MAHYQKTRVLSLVVTWDPLGLRHQELEKHIGLPSPEPWAAVPDHWCTFVTREDMYLERDSGDACPIQGGLWPPSQILGVGP